MTPREERHKVVIPATMRCDAGQIDVCIRDISSRGMLLQAASPPPRGAYVEVVRPGCTVTARVVWRKDRRFGIQSRDHIDLATMLERRTAARSRGATAPRVQMEPPIYARSSRLAREDRSRQVGNMLQSIAVIGAGAAGALLVASMIYQELVQPLAVAAANM